MKVKKNFAVVCDVVVLEDDTWSCTLRTTQGQPVEVLSTPIEVANQLTELSKDQENTDSSKD